MRLGVLGAALLSIYVEKTDDCPKYKGINIKSKGTQTCQLIYREIDSSILYLKPRFKDINPKHRKIILSVENEENWDILTIKGWVNVAGVTYLTPYGLRVKTNSTGTSLCHELGHVGEYETEGKWYDFFFPEKHKGWKDPPFGISLLCENWEDALFSIKEPFLQNLQLPEQPVRQP